VVGLSGHRFIGFVQNHDQIGNRAQGDRVSHEVGVGRAKIAAALVLLSPFVPMLFQGEEFGASAPFLYFTDYDDPELGRMISEGRKREFETFGWSPDQIPDPQDERTFLQSKLNWAELTEEPHASLLQWHKDLIKLRHERSELSDGNLNAIEVRFDEQTQWLVMERSDLRVACNLGKDAVELEVGDGAQILLASDPSIALNGARINLAPDCVAVVAVPLPAY
jgi:maltooligosyltrehalose trehalohydrolase